MKLASRPATVVVCSVAIAALATSAIARPVHPHHRHRAIATAQSAVQPQSLGADRDMRYAGRAAAPAQAGPVVADDRASLNRHGRRSARARAQSHANSAYGGAT